MPRQGSDARKSPNRSSRIRPCSAIPVAAVAALLLWPLTLALAREQLLRMAEKNLIKELLKDYDKKSRPVIDGETPAIERRTTNKENSSTIPIQQVTVEFGLRLVQILDLDEMDQVLTTSMISLYKWRDYHLQWDPDEEDGIKFVHIPTNRIWLPDIALYNYADERLEERRDCAVKVYSTGTVMWHPMAIYKSACEIKIKYFPFDKQVCKLKFGPWTYDGWRVNISYYNNMTKFDIEGMVESPEWKILDNTAEYNEVVYPCCPEPFVDITFWIWIERSTKFYIFILILPCFLLSSLTLVLFWLPPETPAKMVLGMNIFVAFFLLMLLLEKQTPAASDDFPLIGQYYCLNMGIITLSTFLSVIVVNFHFRGDNRQEVPYWLKKQDNGNRSTQGVWASTAPTGAAQVQRISCGFRGRGLQAAAEPRRRRQRYSLSDCLLSPPTDPRAPP